MHWQVPVIWLNWGIQCRTSFARPWVVLQPGWMHILSLGFSFVCRQWTLGTLACKVRLLAHLLVPTRDSLSGFLRHGYRLLLDEVFVLSRIINVEARVISRSRRQYSGYHKNWISQLFYYTLNKKMKVMFLLLHGQEKTQSTWKWWHDYPAVMNCRRTWHDNLTLSVLDMIIV